MNAKIRPTVSSSCSSPTAVRFGEIAALRVSRLDLTRRRATIAESVTVVQGQGLVWGTPKSHERRQVPIPRFLVASCENTSPARSPTSSCLTAYGEAAHYGRRSSAPASTLRPRRSASPNCTHTSCATPPPASPSPAAQTSKSCSRCRPLECCDDDGRLWAPVQRPPRQVADALDTARSEAARSAAAVANAQNPVAKVLPNADVVDLAADKAKGKTAGQPAISDGAPGEIRTRAPASGGRCSIP